MKHVITVICLLLVGCATSQHYNAQARNEKLEDLLIGDWKYSALRVDGVIQLSMTEAVRSLSRFPIISFGADGELDVLDFKKASVLTHTLGDDFIVKSAKYEVRQGMGGKTLLVLMQSPDKVVTATRKLKLELSNRQMVLTAPKIFINGELVDTDLYRENMEYVYRKL